MLRSLRWRKFFRRMAIRPSPKSVARCFPRPAYLVALMPITFVKVRRYLSTAWGTDFHRRLQSPEFRQPWFLFLHLWELHHHRHILPAYSGREYGRNRYERALSSLDAEFATLLAVLPQNTLIVIHGDHGERVVKTDLQYRLYRLSRDLLRHKP